MPNPQPKPHITAKARRPSAGCHVAVLPGAVMIVTDDGHNVVLTPRAIEELVKALPEAAEQAFLARLKNYQDKLL